MTARPVTAAEIAYGLGYDARMDGKPVDENPFYRKSIRNLVLDEHYEWQRGWQDADRELEAKGK